MIEQWHENRDNVLKLAHYLVDECFMSNPDEILHYFEAPWKYGAEWSHINQLAAHKADECMICQCEDADSDEDAE